MQTPAIEPEGQTDWNAMEASQRRVRNLRQRIFKAERVKIRTASGLLEPDALSGARPVLRRLGSSNAPWLSDMPSACPWMTPALISRS